MLCTEAADALAPQTGDLKAEDTLSCLCLRAVKFILNPVLPLCYFLENLVRLGLGQFSVASPLGFKQNLAHFDRQLVATGEPLPQAFLPGLVL